jgi:hypothetical protein
LCNIKCSNTFYIICIWRLMQPRVGCLIWTRGLDV